MSRLRVLGVILFGLLAFSSAALAADPVSPAAEAASVEELDLNPPTIPLACPAGWYPPRGKAFWEGISSPSCLWTCNSGVTGCADTSSAAACKSACKLACGAATSCLVLL
jgi:hypothetical protein